MATEWIRIDLTPEEAEIIEEALFFRVRGITPKTENAPEIINKAMDEYIRKAYQIKDGIRDERLAATKQVG